MTRQKLGISFSVLVVLLVAGGCGGKGIVDLESRPVQTVAYNPVVTMGGSTGSLGAVPVPADWSPTAYTRDDPLQGMSLAVYDPAGRSASRAAPPALADFPELPRADAVAPSTAAREVTVLRDVDLGTTYANSANAIATPASLSLMALLGTPEWAVYEVALAPGHTPLSLGVSGQVVQGGEGLWVGISNYSADRWTWHGPYSLAATAIIDFTSDAYSNAAGNAYIALAVDNGHNVSVTQLRIDVDEQETPLLPTEFHRALTNAGLNVNRLSIQEMYVFSFWDGWTYENWGWDTYLFGDPPEQAYEDLHTVLPTFWNAWWGSDTATTSNPDPFQPPDYPQYVSDKGDTMAAVAGLQDIFLAGVEEMPGDKRVERQDFSAALNPTDPLAQAVADFVDASGGTSDFPTYQTALTGLDVADQQPLATLVYAVQEAIEQRNQIFYGTGTGELGFPDEATVQIWFDGAHGAWAANPTWIPALIYTDTGNYFMRGWPYHTAHFTNAAQIADAVDQLTAYINDNSPTWESVSLDVPTDWGMVRIAGTGDDNHTNPDQHGFAVLIDLGGNDTYDCTAGATASGNNCVSLGIDLGGSDIHVAQDDPLDGNRGIDNDDDTSQQGAGRLGTGIFVDYGGTDVYSAVRMSQGFSMLGVGMLADLGQSDDLYDLEAFGQGAAIGGIGILYDDGGDTTGDEFDCWAMAQGYGGVMGIGILGHYGASGDTYFAEPDYDSNRPEYNSPQMLDVANANFAQGSALGMRWPDPGDPGIQENPTTHLFVVAAGGYGLLYDQGGSDEYDCGVFGQAKGFFHGHGLLIDQGGDDDHYGLYYSQGSSVHCGLAGLWDGRGNDRYENVNSVGVGGANDLSITWFLDREGSDEYHMSGYSCATGMNQAFAYFIDYAGWDQYYPTHADGTLRGLGRAGWPSGSFASEDDPTYGIFVDAHGVDTYDAEFAGMLLGTDATAVVPTPPDDGAEWLRINGDAAAGDGFYINGYGSGVDGQ